MQNINSIASGTGRTLLRDLYKKLRFDQQLSGLRSLYTTLIVAINPSKLSLYDSTAPEITQKTGLAKGLRVWMEEIVSRYYYSTVNSFVYFGAAVLLIIIGLTRFRDDIDIAWVIGGIVFEAILLLLVFLTMLFTPKGEEETNLSSAVDSEMQEDLLDEIGEIARDMAAVSVQFEKVSKQLETHNFNTGNLVQEIRSISEALRDASSPNPRMLEKMNETNNSLEAFQAKIEEFTRTTEILSSKIIEDKVRAELSKILEQRINGGS